MHAHFPRTLLCGYVSGPPPPARAPREPPTSPGYTTGFSGVSNHALRCHSRNISRCRASGGNSGVRGCRRAREGLRDAGQYQGLPRSGCGISGAPARRSCRHVGLLIPLLTSSVHLSEGQGGGGGRKRPASRVKGGVWVLLDYHVVPPGSNLQELGHRRAVTWPGALPSRIIVMATRPNGCIALL